MARLAMCLQKSFCRNLFSTNAQQRIPLFSSNSRGKKPSDVLCQVYSMVDGICKRSFPFVKFHCGPACPSTKCPGYQDNYMHTPYHHYRQHVFNIMPGRQVDKNASLYCVNKSFEDKLKDWIPQLNELPYQLEKVNIAKLSSNKFSKPCYQPGNPNNSHVIHFPFHWVDYNITDINSNTK